MRFSGRARVSVRHRSIAGTPERSAEEATTVLIEMLAETLAPASALDRKVITSELAQGHAAVRMLIAGKHLRDLPIVLAADPLRLEITVVSGDAALTLKENLGKVPGAATATDWMLHVPAPAPITGWVEEALQGLEHVTSERATSQASRSSAGQFTSSQIDPDALRRVAAGES
jgi:hypothetical protein